MDILSERTYLRELPEDILRFAVQYLSYEEIIRLCNSNPNYDRIICLNENFWKSLFLRDYSQDLEKMKVDNTFREFYSRWARKAKGDHLPLTLYSYTTMGFERAVENILNSNVYIPPYRIVNLIKIALRPGKKYYPDIAQLYIDYLNRQRIPYPPQNQQEFDAALECALYSALPNRYLNLASWLVTINPNFQFLDIFKEYSSRQDWQLTPGRIVNDVYDALVYDKPSSRLNFIDTHTYNTRKDILDEYLLLAFCFGRKEIYDKLLSIIPPEDLTY